MFFWQDSEQGFSPGCGRLTSEQHVVETVVANHFKRRPANLLTILQSNIVKLVSSAALAILTRPLLPSILLVQTV